MRKLLIHTCCAPCFSYIENELKEKGLRLEDGKFEKVNFTAFWYNPNIHPKVEYERRKNTFISFCEEHDCKNVVIDEYSLDEYVKYVVENVGENKKYTNRCKYCYYMRLEEAFKYAKENGFDVVTTTLTISPYQNHEFIKKAGSELEEKYKIEFKYVDYRDSYREGQKMARANELYMQKYCGCIFSIDNRKVGILMKKYSKNKLKMKGFSKILIVILIILFILSGAFLAYMLLNNNIVYEKFNDVSNNVSDDQVSNSTPIIVDNLLVGGVYDKKWVSSDKYYLKSKNKSEVEIDIYNAKGKTGKFIMNSLDKSKENAAVFAKTTNTNKVDEYLAIAKNDTNIMLTPASKVVSVTDADINSVKKALGINKIFNSTVKITSVYEAKLDGNGYSKFIFATSEPGKSTGAYSAVIYQDTTGKSKCIKYNYIRNKEDASKWPIYSFKFVADLNLDGINELIIQETKEFEAKYDVLEYKNNDFYEILSSTIKLDK